MSGGSESDVCTSKRPKTKLKISEDVKEGQSDISSHSEDTDALASNKSKNVSSVKNYKKASKRSRESDEESSISTEEEIMSKKRVRKNSEEKFRPKKRVSAEARKRRETVRSVREKIIAALDSDSEDESERKVKSIFKSVSDNKCVTDNSKTGTESKEKAENSDNCVNNTTKEIYSKKDEGSSSAYNSGSEGIKTGEKIAKEKASKSDKSDESDLADTDGDESEVKIARKTFSESRNSGDSESDFSENESNCIKTNTKTVKKYSSKNSCSGSSSENEELNPVSNKVQNSRRISGSKNKTSKSKSELRKKKTAKDEGAQKQLVSSSDSDFGTTVRKKKNKIETSAHEIEKPLPFSETCDSSSDDVPLSKSKIQKKKCIAEDKNNSSSSGHHQIKSKHTKNSSEYNSQHSSYRSDSEEDLFFHEGKPIKNANTKGKVAPSKDALSESNESSEEVIIKHKLKDTSKKGMYKEQQKEEISLYSSEDNRSMKETKIIQSKRNNSKVTVSSKKDMDSLSSSSEDDRSLKITKSVLGKSNSNVKNKKIDPKSDSCHSDKDTTKERKKVYRKGVAKQMEIQNMKDSPESNNKTDNSSEDSDAPLVKGIDIGKAIKDTSITRQRECKNEGNEESLNNKSSRLNKGIKDEDIKKELCSDSESSETYVLNSGQKKIQSNSSSDDSSRKKTQIMKVKQNCSDSPESDSSEENEKKHSVNKLKPTKKIKKNKSKMSAHSGNASDSESQHLKKKNKKELGTWEVRINKYKKFICAVGIRVRSYAAVWEGSKNDKQRAERLLKLLQDHGMKGQPTMQKCKKLRAKIERKREVEELDLNNIIDDGDVNGRYKCRSSRHGQEDVKKPSVVKQEIMASEATEEIKRRLSRIKTFADSDSSSD